MSLSKDDVLHVANLAHIDLSESQILQMQGELNDIFKMIEELRAVNTDGVEPCCIPMTALSGSAKTWSRKRIFVKKRL